MVEGEDFLNVEPGYKIVDDNGEETEINKFGWYVADDILKERFDLVLER